MTTGGLRRRANRLEGTSVSNDDYNFLSSLGNDIKTALSYVVQQQFRDQRQILAVRNVLRFANFKTVKVI